MIGEESILKSQNKKEELICFFIIIFQNLLPILMSHFQINTIYIAQITLHQPIYDIWIRPYNASTAALRSEAFLLWLDLSISTDGSNTGRVYSGSSKIRVGCILGSGKMRAGVFRFYEFRINPTSLKRLFSEFFLFCQNQKFGIFIT